ncbi:hypothetical protein T11_7721 [Trichinella zimbabwensis]|uniref:Uncharacterized protein n=1 Tax=Trichinella zimbabwensis TaxID=268475 RepID=A0A0V1HCR7_9BILA|nr:hypothetical protein T11_7721 [Trichinella zimbabwensis]
MAELMSMSDVDHQVVEKQPVDRKAFNPEDVAEMLVAQAGKQNLVTLFFRWQQQALLFDNKPSRNYAFRFSFLDWKINNKQSIMISSSLQNCRPSQ